MGRCSSIYLVQSDAPFNLFWEKALNAKEDPRKHEVIEACKVATSFAEISAYLSCFQKVEGQVYFRSSLYANPHEDEVGGFVEDILRDMRCITSIFHVYY